jgi:hypothetical protein
MADSAKGAGRGPWPQWWAAGGLRYRIRQPTMKRMVNMLMGANLKIGMASGFQAR